jgi:ribonuclease HI
LTDPEAGRSGTRGTSNILQILWKAFNNKAEYEALLHGLRLAVSLGIKRLLVYGDSLVVINQVNDSWDQHKNMDAYCMEVRKLENKFSGLEFHHVTRDNNVAADALSKLGSTRAQIPAGVFVQELTKPSITEPAHHQTTNKAHQEPGREVMVIDTAWMDPFVDYIKEQKVPDDKTKAKQIMRRSKDYVLVGDKLYKRGASSGILMKCIEQREGQDLLEKIHKGICGNHASSRTLVGKAFRSGFYYPPTLEDAEDVVPRCKACQFFARQQHIPSYKLITIPPT